MKINFHYDCVKALARSAGFTEDDAQLIAYASQYVDDATRESGMSVSEVPRCAKLLYGNGIFRPVESAHDKLDFATDAIFSKRERRSVYVSFHFIPPVKDFTDRIRGYVVQPDSTWARELMQAAKSAVNAAATDEERKQALIRLGIVTHSYADTWSHQGFGGIWEGKINDAHDCQIRANGGFRAYKGKIAPLSIGHGRAGELPDLSDTVWRFRSRAKAKNFVERDNNAEFMKAAEAIFGHFRELTDHGEDWAEVKGSIQASLAEGLDAKKPHAPWRTRFKKVRFEYDGAQWEKEALIPPRRSYAAEGSVEEKPFTWTGDLKWFFFHAEADRQRKEILEGLPG